MPTSEPTSIAVESDGGSVSLVLPNGDQVTILIGPAVGAALGSGQQIQVVFEPAPQTNGDGEGGSSLGGGQITRLAPPVDIRLSPQTGTLSDASLAQTVQIRLPAHATAPGQEFAWLVEAREDGQFLGYIRIVGEFDALTNTLVYTLRLDQLQGTLFLPAIIVPAYVRNQDPDVHMYSSPFKDAVDFGKAAPQFTSFTVVGPQVGRRIYVYNTATNNYGWIDAAGVGPTGS